MEQPGGWWPRLYGRVHAARIERWRRGELDADGFERAQRTWVRNRVFMLFAVLAAVVVVADWLGHDRTSPEQLEHTLILAGLMALFGMVVALRVSRFASYGAQDFLMRQVRAAAERDPACDLTSPPGPAVKPALTFGYGTYQRSIAHANRQLLLATTASLALGGVMVWRPHLLWMAPVIAIVLGMAFYKRFDRRPFLDIAADGIWCRAWGEARHPFSAFKAVYARQNQLQQGVAFVPRAVRELARTLSWTARYSLRSGDGFPAHAGTLTIWATEVGLDRDTLLREMQVRIVAAAKSL